MQKNDVISVTVEAIGSNGEGIAHFDGTTIFVPFVLENETALVKVLKTKGNIAFCKLESLLSASSERAQPVCPVFKKCGGCQLQHLNYSAQLKVKQNLVKTCLKKIGGIEFDVSETVSSPQIYAYRNKLQLPIRSTKSGNKIGFFREGSHDVVEISECPLHGNWSGKLISAIKDYIDFSEVSCYDESAEKGLLKHLVAREINGELLITVVASKDQIPCVNRLIDRLKVDFNEFSLCLNVNKRKDNVIFGERYITLYGTGKIALEEFGVRYEVGAQSFLQVNSAQKEKLYNRVFELSEADENTVVIDGYSGAGVLTAMLAKRAKKAYGVEIIEEAVTAADKLAKENGLEGRMENICGDCAEILPEIIGKSVSENVKTVLVLDPPRKGVDRKIIDSIRACKPEKIVYVSCSPQTLARDLGMIIGNITDENKPKNDLYANVCNYETVIVEPFDMFPNTKHVETLVCLSKKNGKTYQH